MAAVKIAVQVQLYDDTATFAGEGDAADVIAKVLDGLALLAIEAGCPPDQLCERFDEAVAKATDA